jgi:hypothetical protein
MSNGVTVIPVAGGTKVNIVGLGGGTGTSYSLTNVVFTTGNQDISGVKNFTDSINVAGFNSLGMIGNAGFISINNSINDISLRLTFDDVAFSPTIYSVDNYFELGPLNLAGQSICLNPYGPDYGGNVGIFNNYPQYTLDVNGTTNSSQGYQLPDYNNITSPTEGILAYNFISHTITVYNGSTWV